MCAKINGCSMAPLVVKGKVLVGDSGGEFGVRGWLTALNATDGKIAWDGHPMDKAFAPMLTKLAEGVKVK